MADKNRIDRGERRNGEGDQEERRERERKGRRD